METIGRQIEFGRRYHQVDVPSACPICHVHSELTLVNTIEIDNGSRLQVTWRCGYKDCLQQFSCYYSMPKGPLPIELLYVRPIRPVISAFPDVIADISPDFLAIFSQAEEAAQYSLHQIAGPGYRKAFEFLIKDYAKNQQPNKAEQIERDFSGKVVNEFITDQRIQAVARRSLWLGNDETHYLRKWEEHDVNDLVTLIKLTTSWIDIEHMSAAYMAQMPDQK